MTPIILATLTIVWLNVAGAPQSTEIYPNLLTEDCIGSAYLWSEQELNAQIDDGADPNYFWITCSVDAGNIYVTGQIPPGAPVPDMTIINP
jgi:hypothetical protein